MKTILITQSLILVAGIANAVCLNGNPSVAEEYANSQSVFIGKVITEKDVSESANYYGGKNYTVQAQEVFKGNPTNPIVLFSENSSGRFPMTEGGTYLIFFYYESGRYQVDNCGNSGLLSKKQDVVQALRQLNKAMIE